MKFSALVALAMVLSVSARPDFRRARRADTELQNGQDAIAENNRFKTLTADSPCTHGDTACVNDKFAGCVDTKWVLQSCAAGLICASLPNSGALGTTLACTTAAERDSRIAATGANAANTGSKTNQNSNTNTGKSNTGSGTAKPSATPNATKGTGNGKTTQASTKFSATGKASAGNDNSDPQKSLTLAPGALQDYSSDGNADASAGQEPSITSTNNFINFCLEFPDKAKTNGQQVIEGSCNQTPMGVIAAQSKMPSAKFQSPANGATVPANTDLTIAVQMRNMELGHFTNPATSFHMAPQQVNAQGLIKGHSHVTVQKLSALGQTEPVDAQDFVFFKGLNDKGTNGVLSVVVPGGLPKGVYRAATINSSSNHQPALVAVAQRGSLDDMV
ncbi:hypothetical protein C8Q80DRAFT_1106183 [Daedaleopsis nitida]|nr:hypothetical protein C8Q80DRAFT_1106183 [Daedaleopsis nitida]